MTEVETDQDGWEEVLFRILPFAFLIMSLVTQGLLLGTRSLLSELTQLTYSIFLCVLP